MEVKIGIQHSPRELVIDVEQDLDAVEQQVNAALGADDGVLSLTDAKGRRLLVASAKIAYVEIGSGTAGAVGFRS